MNEKERMQRVGELTSTLLDESLTEPQKQELNELLRGDPDACERYLDLTETHAALVHDHVGDDLLPEFSAEKHSAKKVIPFPKISSFAITAAAAVLLLLANGAMTWLGSPNRAEPTTDENWVAVLSRAVDVKWGNRTDSPSEGDGIRAGTLQLQSGLAQIEFFSGASVIVEGPAELKIESASLIECRSGKLRATVPEPAQGFTIITPDYRVVDLGTEFALSVSPDGQSELHVVDGEVRVDDNEGRELRTLETGNAIRSESGAIETVDGGSSAYIDPEGLRGLAEADWQVKYEAWESIRDSLRDDPATLVLFDFEHQKPWDRELQNRRANGPNAAIIGAQWTEGRWPGKGAIEFKRITDRIRLNIPGEFDELTFAARVRVEGLDRWLSSLMLTDNFDSGEVHWQISDEGEMILGVQTDKKEGPNTYSPPVIGPSNLGRWIHVATTANRTTGRVAHYFDGKLVKEEIRKDLTKFRIGDAEIGNWTSGGSSHPIRSLNGRMDEFAILKRALSEEEVQRLHAAGQ